MEIFYLILIVILFLLAISDLIVGVSNDAVNFLNSAIGARAASFRTIMIVAAVGILVGATFSSGMMEVARKGIFNPQHFYFSDIMLIFLAVMVTDVILLDAFNTFGLPTSTTVSIVFELLGAAVAISIIKVYSDPNALALYEYINSAKALAIIAGILLSVVIAFSVGALIQYLSRLLFSFDYERRFKYFGSLWGGIAIAAITYFMIVKGASGVSFITEQTKTDIAEHAFFIILFSFIGWTVILEILHQIIRLDILQFIVLVGTFALAMAFAGNDLVNFIGVPLAGYNSYELFVQNGSTGADSFLMGGLAGKVPTPTFLLLLAGLVMVATLWTSKKARSVVQTSLDLGRQDSGDYERFSSTFLSRSIVRNVTVFATYVGTLLPGNVKRTISDQFDQKPFIEKQKAFGSEAPAFDMIRASVTLIVSSILIALGTSLKLPLSTTYVTFMVFMGASLADGAWGRESAVYRITGVLSVIGGWFFTALSAFTVAFALAFLFYYGGMIAIVALLVTAVILIYRTHRYHGEKLKEELALAKEAEGEVVTKSKILEKNTGQLSGALEQLNEEIEQTLDGLLREDLAALNANVKAFEKTHKKIKKIKRQASAQLHKIPESDMQAGHFNLLMADYLNQMAQNVRQIVIPGMNHVDNAHKPLLPTQVEELKGIHAILKERFDAIVQILKNYSPAEAERLNQSFPVLIKAIRAARKNQIKRIKNQEIGTRNSVLFLNILGELRNLGLFSNRLLKIYEDLLINPEEEV